MRGPVVTLLSHVDTVLADAEDWQHDPWSGDVVDGCSGSRRDRHEVADRRGARGRDRPRSRRLAARDGLLRLLVVADEEVGGTLGARWLCAEHPALVRSDVVINEGGGAQLHFGDRRHYSIGVGEKASAGSRCACVAGPAMPPPRGSPTTRCCTCCR